MSESKNQDYAITRAVRFKLEPINNALSKEIKPLEDNIGKSSSENIDNLYKFNAQIINAVKEYIFVTKTNNDDETILDDDGKPRQFLNNLITVKAKDWLKPFCKSYFFTNQISDKTPALSDIKYLNEVMQNWFERWEDNNARLEKAISSKEESLTRRSEYALIIGEFSKKDNFDFIKYFIKESNPKEGKAEKSKRNCLDIIKEIDKLLTSCEEEYRSSQSSGINIARASLNYYVINKNPINYKQKLEQLNNELYEKPTNFITKVNNITFANKKGFKEFTSNSIDDLYLDLKQYIAEEKAKFNEAVQKGLTFEELQQNHPLFSCEDDCKHSKDSKDCRKLHFDAYISQTKQIEKLGNDKNEAHRNNQEDRKRKLSKQISELKIERGKYFFQTIAVYPPRDNNNPWARALAGKSGKLKHSEVGAKLYKSLCNKYKEIAMNRGKTIAQIKGIEKEKQESQLLNYWAMFLETKTNKQQLLLVPKEHKEKAKAQLDDAPKGNDQANGTKLYYFKSLTFRALQKLCEQDEFLKGIKAELPQYRNIEGVFSFGLNISKSKEKEIKDLRRQKKYSDIKRIEASIPIEAERQKLEFYKAVLGSNYITTLDINDFSSIDRALDDNITTIEQFEIALEKYAYIKITITDKDIINTVKHIEGVSILGITSSDLEKDPENKSADKLHTQIWKQLWSEQNKTDKYPTRINPELRISWREAKPNRLKKYDKNSENYDAKKFSQNRQLHNQLTLITTITTNANGARTDLRFASISELENNIIKFNNKFNESKIKDKQNNIYYLGMDRGQAELATCSLLTKFTDKGEPTFGKFEAYKLKDLKAQKQYIYKTDGKNHKKGDIKYRKAVDNISYFMSDEELNNSDLFEKQDVISVDMTIAKVIKGKLIINGDIKSYLRLKELNAKRRIFDNFSKKQINLDLDNPFKFDEVEQKYTLETNEGVKPVYYFRKDLAEVCDKNEVLKMLETYLSQLKIENREQDILTMEKINHLRDAMSANMVGVMMWLYKQFKPVFVLEDLNNSTVAKHFEENYENISRRLEYKLYSRLQREGLVPPQLKEAILIRNEKTSKGIKQIGNILYIDESGTSKTCPNCSKNAAKNGLTSEDEKAWKIEFDQNKFNNRQFYCPHCGFEASPNKSDMGLQSPDDVACYNISKKGFEYFKNSKNLEKSLVTVESKKKEERKQGRTTHSNNRSHSNYSNYQKEEPKNQALADILAKAKNRGGLGR